MNEAKRQIDRVMPELLDLVRPLSEGLKGPLDNILYVWVPGLTNDDIVIQALVNTEEGFELGIWDAAYSQSIFCSCVGWRREMPDEFFTRAHKALHRFIERLMEEFKLIAEPCRPLLAILEPTLA